MPEHRIVAEREAILLAILASARPVWLTPRDVSMVARRRALRMAPGSIRAILDRLADDGRCDRQRGHGNDACFRARLFDGSETDA